VLIDLNGYTQGARMGIFAQRPAPIAASYLGFSGTTGTDYIDYVLADRIVVPKEDFPSFSEKVVWLPGSFMVNDSARPIAERTPARGELGLPEEDFVFCCFNQPYKIGPAVFDVWMRLLHAVDGSVLWLKENGAAASDNLRREAANRGVAPERLIFAGSVPLAADHLARQRQADLFLDTLPYNAHATTSDALWAGLPVVTCLGEAFAGRVAASLLAAVGLDELITTSIADYEALALKLARDKALLGAIKAKLAQNRGSCALFDTARFTRHIESAYLTMAQRQSRGERPQSFAVDISS
jgi:predicted O-linked N-acetylglucosamine transferase (SPINDLY family)